MGKIGITCRQPFLGAEEWIQEDLKKASGADEGEEKVEDKKEEKVEAKKEKKEEKVEAKKEKKEEKVEAE
jgi:DNA-directed RNA polymerase subunit E'